MGQLTVYVPNSGEFPLQGSTVSTDANGIKYTSLQFLEANSAAILAATQALNPSRTQVTGSTTISAAQSGSASLAGTTGKTTYLTGFTVIAGAVAAEVEGNVTITGLISGTMNYRLIETVSAGGVINVQFSSGIAASAPNTAITVNVPAITGGGAVSVAMTGYQQ